MTQFKVGDEFEILPGYAFEGEVYRVIDVDAPIGMSVRVTGQNGHRSVTMEQDHIRMAPSSRSPGCYSLGEVKTMIEQAYMAGQFNDGAGCDPSYSMAQNYANRVLSE